MFDRYAADRGRRGVRSVAAVVLVTTLAACSGSPQPPEGAAWVSAGAGGHNSSAIARAAIASPESAWSRTFGEPTPSPAVIASTGQIFVAVDAPYCNLYGLDMESGRKRFCSNLGPAVTPPTTDSVANVYTGFAGESRSMNEHGQIRWSARVYGTPRPAVDLKDGNVLVVTHLGQVNVLDTTSGQHSMPILDLLPSPSYSDGPVEFGDPTAGVQDCADGGAACPVAAAPAFDATSGTLYLVLWRAGAIAPQLVSLQYTGGANPTLTERWSSDLLPAAVSSSPVLSADAGTVYLADTDGNLLAFDTESGARRWAIPSVGGTDSPVVTADHLIIPSTGDNTHLRALRDTGESLESAWDRYDLSQRGAMAVADSTLLQVVGGAGSQALVGLDVATGDTLWTVGLPDDAGYATGVAVGPDGEIVVTSALGEVRVLR